MSEKEKMLIGERYDASDIELMRDKKNARSVCKRYDEDENEVSLNALTSSFGKAGKGLFIKPPFRFDYGYQIFAGDNLFVNFDCVFLDAGKIVIGNNVKIGPKVMIFAVDHPKDPTERASNINIPKDVHIGDNVWIGGGAIIMPGVKIGDNAIVGAGSIVNKDVPNNAIVAGNPARIINWVNPIEGK